MRTTRVNVLRAAGLAIDKPGVLTYSPPGGAVVRFARVGPFEAALLTACRRGPVRERTAMLAMWGEERPAKQVRNIASRLSRKLADLGCPARVGVDRGTVGLRDL